jgi:CBS domain-containing protein
MVKPAKEVPMRAARDVVRTSTDGQPLSRLPLDAPGTAVMTDFDRMPLVTVEAETQIDDALRLMKHAGVRSAIVVDGNSTLLGLVTAYDILGEKPVRLLESGGRDSRAAGRAGIDVAAVMQPTAHWRVIDVENLARSSVADIIETFRRSGRTHIVVVERSAASDRLRGLLSATEVTRRTGVQIDTLTAAATFAEIEQAVHEGVLST